MTWFARCVVFVSVQFSDTLFLNRFCYAGTPSCATPSLDTVSTFSPVEQFSAEQRGRGCRPCRPFVS